MNVFLDDVRRAPDGFLLVRRAEEAIDCLLTRNVEVLSLDHDLGDADTATGYDVLLWLEERVAMKEMSPPSVIRIHSANVGARKKMEQAIESIRRFERENRG